MEIREPRAQSLHSDHARGPRAGGAAQGAMLARVEQARTMLERRIEGTLGQLQGRLDQAKAKGVDGQKLDALIERTRARFDRLAEQAVAGLEQAIARLRSTRDVPAAGAGDERVPGQSPEALAAQARRELEGRAQSVISALGARIGQATATARDPEALTGLIAAARMQLSSVLAAARESLEARIQSALGTGSSPDGAARVADVDSADISVAGELLARAEDDVGPRETSLTRLLELQDLYATGRLNSDERIELTARRLLE